MQITELPKPSRCFCMIPRDQLLYWVKKRYSEHISTVDLLNSTNDPREKEVISIVALLDVDDETMLHMMQNVPRDDKHILECRILAREIAGLA